MTRPPTAQVHWTLRPARDADKDAIAHLWFTAWPDGHWGNVPHELVVSRSLPAFEVLVSSRVSHTTVAESDAGLLGFVTVVDDEVEQIYVARSARGKGLADQLLDHAEGQISERFDSAWLAVVAGNAAARRFYEKRGWQDGGTFDYLAEAGDGRVRVPCQRYEKSLFGDDPADH